MRCHCGSALCMWPFCKLVLTTFIRQMVSMHVCMLQVTLGADRLEQRLEVQNIDDDAPLSFTTALHTYFTVSSIHNVLSQSRPPCCLASIICFN